MPAACSEQSPFAAGQIERFGALFLEGCEGGRLDAPHGIGQGFRNTYLVERLIVDEAGVPQEEAKALDNRLYSGISPLRARLRGYSMNCPSMNCP